MSSRHRRTSPSRSRSRHRRSRSRVGRDARSRRAANATVNASQVQIDVIKGPAPSALMGGGGGGVLHAREAATAVRVHATVETNAPANATVNASQVKIDVLKGPAPSALMGGGGGTLHAREAATAVRVHATVETNAPANATVNAPQVKIAKRRCAAQVNLPLS